MADAAGAAARYDDEAEDGGRSIQGAVRLSSSHSEECSESVGDENLLDANIDAMVAERASPCEDGGTDWLSEGECACAACKSPKFCSECQLEMSRNEWCSTSFGGRWMVRWEVA